jgi:hypothetical protein
VRALAWHWSARCHLPAGRAAPAGPRPPAGAEPPPSASRGLLQQDLRHEEPQEDSWDGALLQCIISSPAQVAKAASDVLDLLFGSTGAALPYPRQTLLDSIRVKPRGGDLLGCCRFSCGHGVWKSLFGAGACCGPDAIDIYLDGDSTGVRVAMTLAHELMHVFFHSLRHQHPGRRDSPLHGEEGLCELAAYYVGLHLRGGQLCEHTHEMLHGELVQEAQLDWREEHNHSQYRRHFRAALRAYRSSSEGGGTLGEYVAAEFLRGGLGEPAAPGAASSRLAVLGAGRGPSSWRQACSHCIPSLPSPLPRRCPGRGCSITRLAAARRRSRPCRAPPAPWRAQAVQAR